MVKPHSPIAEVKQSSCSLNEKLSRPQEQEQEREDLVVKKSCFRDPTTPTNCSSTKKQRKRKVHFAPKIRCRDVPHFSYYSKELHEQVWMSEAEFLIIRASAKATVKLMMSRREISQYDLDEFCPRGLEDRTRQGLRERSRNKEAVRDAVLKEQEAQWDEDVYDPEFLAAVSLSRSRDSSEKAWQRAQLDAEEANQYLKGS